MAVTKNISNKPAITDDTMTNMLRSQIEQRAEWFFLMNDEAAKRGHDWEEYCRPAIFRCGCFRGDEMLQSFADKGDLVELGEYFKNNPNTKVFEKEYITITPEKLEMHFHYCPLVAGWQKMTDDEELIAKCCDVAMDGDRGIFSRIPDCAFTLDGTLAEGQPVCKLILEKTK
ncbi:L-2-amino-thiazoline-4-carboxylic acid hydrolase [Oscillospiraceae bacterium MB08-C2-2]|nr:L-2-amino-thiazoline-4-carboxylic acid hydrolase [Oscillospiraceae bacterium MB08-C2-2]